MDEPYEELLDNIVSELVTFSSYGSGWQLLKIVVADKITFFVIFPEAHPVRCDSNLLSIHNTNDDKCFLYCYTAGYHLLYKKETLEPPEPCFRQRTDVLTVRNQELNNLKVFLTCQWVHWAYPGSKTWTKWKSTHSGSRKLFILN